MCKNLTNNGYCDIHTKQKRNNYSRKDYQKWYSDRTWRRTRLNYLREHPLCVKCLEKDKLVGAEVVDHIEPHKGDRKLFWDRTNWQSLCKQCHDRKTVTEDGGFGNETQACK